MNYENILVKITSLYLHGCFNMVNWKYAIFGRPHIYV